MTRYPSVTLPVLLSAAVVHCGTATDSGAPDAKSGPEGDAALPSLPDGTADSDPTGTTMGGSDGSGADGAATDVATATGQDALPPPHVVGTCNAVAAPGTWEQITPMQIVSQMPGPGNCTFGTQGFVLDPSRSGTVYLATCHMGMYKSTDCGSTWIHVDTGQNGAVIDTSRQWTFTIDPINPQVLYANSGYGDMSNGAFKSTDGGVDWQQIWPSADPTQANIVQYDFVMLIAMDPTNHLHLLLSFHASCSAPYNSACFAESQDGGATWIMHNGLANWAGGEAQTIYFLDNSTTWLWASGTDGLWRTSDSGANWTQVDPNAGGHNSAPLYHAHDGSFYLSLNSGILRSTDGVNWSRVLSQTTLDITGNGMTLFASVGFPWNPGQGPAPYEPFWRSPESDGRNWTQIPSPSLSNGGRLAYDVDHSILYSSNLDAGFWRVVIQ
jgi:hypothetical protein